MTTKAQEREILAKIEKLIDSAGPDSYIGAAFTGCVELARDNIDNDFCQNFPDRLDRLTHDNGVLSKAVDTMSAEIRALKEQKAQLDADLKTAIKKQLPADLFRDLWLMVEARRCSAEKEIEQEAEVLARFADCPQDIAVGVSLKRLAAATARRNEAAAMLERLEKYE